MITVDMRDRKPIYEQLIENIRTQAVQGYLKPDEHLPSVRQLAAELAINPNTIQKAYAELERQGITYSVPGRGSFVSTDLHAVTVEHRRRILSTARTLMEEAQSTGMDAADFLSLVGQVWKEDSAQ